MKFLWTISILFIECTRGNTILQTQKNSADNSFVVSAGYGVQHENTQSFAENLTRRLSNKLTARQPKSFAEEDVIYGSNTNSDNQKSIQQRSYDGEDPENPSLQDLQEFIRKLEKSKSSKIVRVLKVPAVYEIHMHGNKDTNEEFIRIPPEHFENLKLNQGYMKKINKDIVHSKQPIYKNHYKNLRQIQVGTSPPHHHIFNNIPAVIKQPNGVQNLSPNNNNQNQLYSYPNFDYSIQNIVKAITPPIVNNTSLHQNGYGAEVYKGADSNLVEQGVQLNDSNQPQAIYEVPAPVLGKFPYPKPFSKHIFYHKNHRYNLTMPQNGQDNHHKRPPNHQQSPSNSSPIYYLQNNVLPDLSLYFKTKQEVNKHNIINDIEKSNLVWDSQKIQSKNNYVDFTRKSKYMRPQRRSYVTEKVYPVMKFILHVKERTFGGD